MADLRFLQSQRLVRCSGFAVQVPHFRFNYEPSQLFPIGVIAGQDHFESHHSFQRKAAIASVLAAMVLVVLDAAIANVALPPHRPIAASDAGNVRLDRHRLPNRPADGPAAVRRAREASATGAYSRSVWPCLPRRPRSAPWRHPTRGW